MSELTLCNHCHLLRFQAEAKRKGWHVTLKPKPYNVWKSALDVYMHPPGARLTKRHWVAWFAELPDHCVC